MRRTLSVVIFLAGIAANTLSAAPWDFSYYVTDVLNVRTQGSLSAGIVTTLPKYTAIRVIKRGRVETIDGITASWVRITSQTGYTGWCFSGYVRAIEKNVAHGLAASFAQRKSASFPGKDQDYSAASNVTSIAAISAASGYYIQQEPRGMQRHGHAPEILQLIVENKRAFIKEVDIVNARTVVRNQIELRFDGKTFAHGKTFLKSLKGEMLIFYREHIPKKQWLGTWDYEQPYSIAGTDNAPMTAKVYRLTTDYLRTFAGRYAFASYEIIDKDNATIFLTGLKKAVITVKYNSKKKCLTTPVHQLIDSYSPDDTVGDYQFNFVETAPANPFFWTYGEGAGFTEERFFFYKGGIAFTDESLGFDFEKNQESGTRAYIKYVAFFKKVS